MTAKSLRRAHKLFLASVGAVGYAGSSLAADNTFSWTGPAAAGGNVSWTLAANWLGGVAPPMTPAVGDTTTLWFGGNLNTGTSAQNAAGGAANPSDYDLHRMVFDLYNAGAATLFTNSTGTGSRLIRLGAGGLVYNAAGSVNLGGSNGSDRRLLLTADQNWEINNAGTGNMIVRRPIDGAFKITKIGVGTLQITPSVTGTANPWTGGIAINDGNVRLDTIGNGGLGSGTVEMLSANSVGIAASGATSLPQTLTNQFNLGGGGIFNMRGSWEMLFNGTVNFAGPITWNVNVPSGAGAGVHTINGLIKGAGAWTKGGGGTLIISDTADASGFSGNLAITNGALSIGTIGQLGTGTNPILLGSSVAAAGTTTINSGSLVIRSAGQTTNRGFALDNGGGNLEYAGDLTINNSIAGTGPLTKVGAGVLTAQTIQVATLTTATSATHLSGDGSDAAVSKVRALNLGGVTGAWTSTLDTGANSLIVDYDVADPNPFTQIVDQLKSGYAGGAWNGTGIQSIAAAASGGETALGFAEASVALGPSGGTFKGQSVDGTAVLVRYTRYGDANIDGTVDTIDFNLLAANFGMDPRSWYDGDFDFTGTVDTIDFNLLAANFGKTLPGPGVSAQLVPEPTFAAITSLAMLGTGRRRRSIRTV